MWSEDTRQYVAWVSWQSHTHFHSVHKQFSRFLQDARNWSILSSHHVDSIWSLRISKLVATWYSFYPLVYRKWSTTGISYTVHLCNAIISSSRITHRLRCSHFLFTFLRLVLANIIFYYLLKNSLLYNSFDILFPHYYWSSCILWFPKYLFNSTLISLFLIRSVTTILF